MTGSREDNDIPVVLVLAAAENGVIGRGDALPWDLPDDLRHFKRTTLGRPIIMGRKTFESIGKPLPNRNNIIVSRDTNLHIEGCTIVHSLADIQEIDGFIIGGSNIYSQTLDIAEKLYITEVDGNFSGDAHFPEFNKTCWQLISEEKRPIDAKNKYGYTFKVFEKNTTV